ncbi:hypothetical protein FACS18949_16610 [Clostridia bacterium]|nr:hypothetical protein FACS18949_16610 [Clostridia bacterium]
MIYILAFLLCGVGIFVILRLSPTRMVESAIERGERKTLYARIQEVQKPKAPKGLKRAVIEARTALVAMKKGPMFVVTILVASGTGIWIFGVISMVSL